MSIELPKLLKPYRVKRYLVEEYEILAYSKSEAKRILEERGVTDPVKVTVLKETIK